jgi:hypothetical protein
MYTNNNGFPRWWDTISHRRRYVSDRTWMGLAGLTAGLGNVGWMPGAWKVGPIVIALAGAASAFLGLRRAFARVDPATGAVHPAPPW